MDDGGLGGSGGTGGGGGGEHIGVAQEADTGCCCSISVDGMMNCQVTASANNCPPYTTNTPGACSDTGGTGNGGGCSASGVRSGAGGGVEVFVLLLALAAYRGMLRRFARG